MGYGWGLKDGELNQIYLKCRKGVGEEEEEEKTVEGEKLCAEWRGVLKDARKSGMK